MERRSVDSSVLRAVGYDADHQILEVEFGNGRVYRYLRVPELVYRRLMKAPSIGGYYNAEIRDHYASERIREGEDAPPLTR